MPSKKTRKTFYQHGKDENDLGIIGLIQTIAQHTCIGNKYTYLQNGLLYSTKKIFSSEYGFFNEWYEYKRKNLDMIKVDMD